MNHRKVYCVIVLQLYFIVNIIKLECIRTGGVCSSNRSLLSGQNYRTILKIEHLVTCLDTMAFVDSMGVHVTIFSTTDFMELTLTLATHSCALLTYMVISMLTVCV